MADNQGPPAQQPNQQRTSGWQYVRSFLMQMVIFYFITSFFRGGQKQPVDDSGSPIQPSQNFFRFNDKLDLVVYISQLEDMARFSDNEVLWQLEGITYGSWDEGPSKDSTWTKSIEVVVPEAVQDNGSWWLHVFIKKAGTPVDPNEEYYDHQSVVHQKKMLTKYMKQRVHKTVNLLTGEPNLDTVTLADVDAPVEIISYWHPNLTLNLVADQTPWIRGAIPPPMDQFVIFDNTSDRQGYYPIVFLNDYWNLFQEYMPINETTKTLNLTLTFYPLSLFKFQMYAAMTTKNQWSELMGQGSQSDEEQDAVKQTLLDTNPYLLGLTMVVTLVHMVFEFLAFKNDIQFWKSRESIEGLSVRSVSFNVFQSLIVLLYILDNETSFVIIISCFVGLLIELWKITKVYKISIDRERYILGIFPRISFADHPSYVDSSTKEYDKMAFRYLGWTLFPLFICYGVYSLIYQEHKGWYSFVLGMCYGFLLTFGFITMTPQLFINYKLKSVAHLPWRMLTYKAFNTFIDDMFAFVIKMPTMYRIGCFRDDIVFFIFLYQRWIYRVDPKRVNEFGTSGEDEMEKKDKQKTKERQGEVNSNVAIPEEPVSGSEPSEHLESNVRRRIVRTDNMQ